MRVLLSTVGTRGDVQPVLALALKLRELDHDVRLCVPPNFVEQASGLGFDTRPLGIEMRAQRPGEGAPTTIPDLISNQFDVVVPAARGCDLIVGGGAHQYAARSAAELYGIPCAIAVYSPTSIPSPALPPGGQTDFPGDAVQNKRLWEEHKAAWNGRALERVNANRARWQLDPIQDVLDHILGRQVWLAAEAALGPAPSPTELEVVQPGAWIMEDNRALSPELSAFLAAGEPPIYFGFGSMPAQQRAVGTLTKAAHKLGRRMVLSRGWAELASVGQGPPCIVIDEVNQQALFPRIAAVVHHGGAGTTTIAAKAGVPQVVMPMFSDQFYWGFRLGRLELGAVVPMASVSVDSLVEALRQALEPETVSRASAFALRVASDGAEVAARQLLELSR
jgi:vancomycin aglycone glucosyltransferase